MAKTVKVTYTGLLPDLFREGQGVVAEGVLERPGAFRADSVLAKHDETYMPREVADALKKNGEWRGRGAAGEAAVEPPPRVRRARPDHDAMRRRMIVETGHYRAGAGPGPRARAGRSCRSGARCGATPP